MFTLLLRATLSVWAVGFGLGVWGFAVEPRLLVVHHVAIASAAWDGPPLRIGVIADTQTGGVHVPGERVERVVARMNASQPDVVVLLGDYVDGHDPRPKRGDGFRRQVERGLVAFGDLDAPLGAVSILGNHDWWYDGADVRSRLEGAGVTVLENDAVRIERAAGAFWIAGLADMDTRRPDVDRALDAIGAEPALLLSHHPDVFVGAPATIALTLAGHTHGGQIRVPILGRPAANSRFGQRLLYGHVEEEGRHLFVSSGVGTSVLPVRFGVPPEIVIIELSAAEGADDSE